MDNARGRPRKAVKDRRQTRFQIRLSPTELKEIERAADGRPSTWAREVLLREARKAKR